MTAPNWIEAVVRDFGRGAGLADFALNARGAAASRAAVVRSVRRFIEASPNFGGC